MPLPFRFRWPKGLKANLVGAMLLTVGTTAAIVYVPWLLVSKRNLETIINQVNQEINLGTSQEVEKLFNICESAQMLLNSTLADNLIDRTNPQERELFLLNVLRANPSLAWAQYGEASGDFFGAQRTTDGQLQFHWRNWRGDSRTTTTTINTYTAAEQRLTQTATQIYAMNPAYFTPDQRWYNNALQSPQELVWTVYLQGTTQAPGLGATTALVDDQGGILGVVSVSVGLEQLSEYLQRFKGDHRREAFIITAGQELIASTDIEAVPTALAGAGATLYQGADAEGADYVDLPLPQLSETRNPLLQVASQTLQDKGLNLETLTGLRQFSLTDPATGERYLVSFSRLKQLDWVVGTVIPEANYLAEVNRNQRILVTVITLFTALMAIAAILMANRLIVRPVLGIARTAADVEEGKFELGHLNAIGRRRDEIGQLARVFDRMAQEIHSREQKLKQQVRGLRIEIDEVKRQQQVQEIVETEFFQDLTAKAKSLRDSDSDSRETDQA